MVYNLFLLHQTGLVQEQALSAVDAQISLCLSGNDNRNPLVLFKRFN